MDVVRAADPAQVQAAQAKLKANHAAFAANSLAEAGKGFGAAMDIIDNVATKAGLGNVSRTAGARETMPEAYRGFEASVLQTFVNSMLPQDSEEVYGKGSAGEIWKGMMAEQIATAMSKDGGIGIAEQLFDQARLRAENKGVVNAVMDENAKNQAMNMVTEFERDVLGLSASKQEIA